MILFWRLFFHEQKEKLKKKSFSEMGFLMGTYLTLPCTKSFPSFFSPLIRERERERERLGENICTQ
jgi:hypothetical protein